MTESNVSDDEVEAAADAIYGTRGVCGRAATMSKKDALITARLVLSAAAKVRAIREGDGEVEALLNKAQELSNAMVAQGARKQIGALYSQAVTLGHMVKHVRDLRAASPAATEGGEE